MAREWNKNTSNSTIFNSARPLGALINGAKAVVVSCWCYPTYVDVSTGNFRNTFLDIEIQTAGSSTGKPGVRLALYAPSATNSFKFSLSAASTNGDSTAIMNANTTFSTGQYYHVLGQVDYTNKAMQVYVNGTLDLNATGLTFGSNTYTHTSWASGRYPDAIGCISNASNVPYGTPYQFNGRLAELAIWAIPIGESWFTQEEASALAGGANSLRIRTPRLVYYDPIYSASSLLGNHVSPNIKPTLRGSIPAFRHPKVSPMRSRLAYVPYAASEPPPPPPPSGSSLRTLALTGVGI